MVNDITRPASTTADEVCHLVSEYGRPLREWAFKDLVIFHRKAEYIYQKFDADREYYLQLPPDDESRQVLSNMGIQYYGDLKALWDKVYFIYLSTTLVRPIIENQNAPTSSTPNSIDPDRSRKGFFADVTLKHWQSANENFIEQYEAPSSSTTFEFEEGRSAHAVNLTKILNRCWRKLGCQRHLPYERQVVNAAEVVKEATAMALQAIELDNLMLQSILVMIFYQANYRAFIRNLSDIHQDSKEYLLDRVANNQNTSWKVYRQTRDFFSVMKWKLLGLSPFERRLSMAAPTRPL